MALQSKEGFTMWFYYVLILTSVMLFGGGFALQDLYRKKRGSGLRISMESACIGAFAGLIVLLIVNGFDFEFTWFTLLMALWATLNGMLFTFCAFKAFDYINLSLFSVFAMLGGMMLPFLQGIFFYDEGFTLAKAVCLCFICAALVCTVEKGEKKKGAIFYAGIFILNGMAGVISKIFTTSELPKASAAGYSIWIAATTVLLSGITWLSLSFQERRRTRYPTEKLFGEERNIRLQSYGIGALCGAVSRVANFLLVIALVYVDASVQYPMVTGGTMIVSTLLSYLGDKKPNKREILSVALSFIGMLALFFIPV
jgi:drug/metabolite transporter (DMT)-like permease